MMTRVVLVALALAVPAGAWAQGKADFSGTWKLVKDEPAGFKGPEPTAVTLRPSPGRGFGTHAPTLVIKQTASEITVDATHFGEYEGRKMTYKLDGSETVMDDPKYPGTAGFRWMTKARWEGDTLILFTYQGWNHFIDRLSLSGGQLTIRRDADGQSTFAGGNRLTHTLVYSKTS